MRVRIKIRIHIFSINSKSCNDRKRLRPRGHLYVSPCGGVDSFLHRGLHLVHQCLTHTGCTEEQQLVGLEALLNVAGGVRDPQSDQRIKLCGRRTSSVTLLKQPRVHTQWVQISAVSMVTQPTVMTSLKSSTFINSDSIQQHGGFMMTKADED